MNRFDIAVIVTLKRLREFWRRFHVRITVWGSGIWFFLICTSSSMGQSWVRVNQLGYRPDMPKVAVFVTKDTSVRLSTFSVHDAFSDAEVFTGDAGRRFGQYGPFSAGYRLDFSDLRLEGGFYIKGGSARSPIIRIDKSSYRGAADVLLRYMRQQRCGFNPFLRDSCHMHDGFIIYRSPYDSTHIDVTGGWHDASDYLQYAATSAHAVVQLLFAYSMHPSAFGDRYRENGLPGANGRPDVLDEADWGLQWLLKMNPDSGVMYQQIADDRDHAGFRLPTDDPVTYGKGQERPVYFVTGTPQGIFDHTNRSTGVASIAAKFSSAFALGSRAFRRIQASVADTFARKAVQAYEFALSKPGVSQTAPCKAPYFYEEGNWTDDMQLASALLGELLGDRSLFDTSLAFGDMETVTPWMGADTARHYEWYPFVNLGWYVLAKNGNAGQRSKVIAWMKEGIERVWQKGSENVFLFGIPFIWCSNNLVSAMLTHLRLYRIVSGDEEYVRLENALIDWLFGANPWGTSMIYGLPAWGDTPTDPHSAFTHHYGYPIDGGLVDGPVYGSIFDGLIGLHLSGSDPYEAFQSKLAVYHDDWGDYSTNEPTMDGTASLSYVLAALAAEGNNGRADPFEHAVLNHGAITRMDTTRKKVYLVFTGHEFADGGRHVLRVLHDQDVRASFFFTGDFYRNPKFTRVIGDIHRAGYYLGAHSDKHLLYASWESRDSTLVTHDEWWEDLRANYREMQRFGISASDARFFMPPYEWYNDSIAAWTSAVGLRLVNFTPGTLTNGDYTVPSMGDHYYPSRMIEDRLWSVESTSRLNGHILLMHIGTDPERTDKFYDRLNRLIRLLKEKGYSFGSFSDF